jgi:hypothetical protein
MTLANLTTKNGGWVLSTWVQNRMALAHLQPQRITAGMWALLEMRWLGREPKTTE